MLMSLLLDKISFSIEESDTNLFHVEFVEIE